MPFLLQVIPPCPRFPKPCCTTLLGLSGLQLVRNFFPFISGRLTCSIFSSSRSVNLSSGVIINSSSFSFREEKGYGDDELSLKVVDLGKGENFDPTYLRLNPKATVPTLVVPLQNTLSEDVDSRFKAITETKVNLCFSHQAMILMHMSKQAIVEFLDKSRSAVSRTHTTSFAPAPSLAPATIAINTTCETIIGDLHSEEGNPNNLRYLNARDERSLCNLAKETIPLLAGKQKALVHHISNAENNKIHVSQKVIKFWGEKKAAVELWLDVLLDASQPDTELDANAKAKRLEFFNVAQVAWETALSNTLTKLSKEIIGPYALGGCGIDIV
jgi:hypothetical protein